MQTINQKLICCKVKELLLRKNITSQVIDASKVTENPNFQYSLTNIAVAVLAKLTM